MDLDKTLPSTIFILTATLVLVYIVYNYISGKRRVLDIHKKAVFITGCDSGFGRLLCKQLDQLGCPVFAGCFTEAGAQSLQNETSSNLKTLMLDVRSPESIVNAQKLITDNLENGKKLWGVVNNAGIATFGLPMEFFTREEYEEMIQINYVGPVDIILKFLPMIADSKGRIVNVSSMIAKMPIPMCGAYAGSKFAIAGFSESLRREKQSWGINVSTIFPGQFYTGITDPNHVDRQLKKYWNRQPDEIKKQYNEEDFKAVLEGYVNIMTNYGNRKLHLVTNDIENALFSLYPKSNYYPGLDAKIFPVLESLPFDIFPKLQTQAWKYGKILDDHIRKRNSKNKK